MTIFKFVLSHWAYSLLAITNTQGLQRISICQYESISYTNIYVLDIVS